MNVKIRLKYLVAIIRKECFQILRDPSAILLSGIFPLLLLFLYGTGLSLDNKNLSLAIVNNNYSPIANNFIQSLIHSPSFSITYGTDLREMEPLLIEGKVLGIVVIPLDFPDKTPLRIITDGSEPNTAKFVHSYVEMALHSYLAQESLAEGFPYSPPINLEVRNWFNEGLESRNFIIPGSIAIIMALIGSLLTSLVISREWELGTFESLMSTPVTIIEILLGKMIPYFFLAMGSMLICVTVATLFYNVPLRGSLWVLTATTSIFLLSSLGLGLLSSSLFKKQLPAAQMALMIGFLPAFMLSGFIFEIESMPLPIYLMTYLLPPRFFVSSLKTIFLVGNLWTEIFLDTAIIATLAFFFFFLASKITVKRLD